MTAIADQLTLTHALHGGELDAARTLALGQLTDARWQSDLASEVQSLASLSVVATRRNDTAAARAAACEALSLAQSSVSPLSEGRATKAVAVAEFRLGRLKAAEQLVLQGVAALLPSYSRSPELYELVHTMAWIKRRDGFADDARQLFAQALSGYEQRADLAWMARCQKPLGDLASRDGDMAEADRRYEAARANFHLTGDRLGQANVLRALAETATSRSNLTMASENFEQALAAYRDAQDLLGVANTFVGLGEVAALRGDGERAIKHLTAAIESGGHAADDLAQANAFHERTDVHFRRGHLEDAAADNLVALTLYRELGNRLGEANALRASADLALARDLVSEAIAGFEAALAIYSKARMANGAGNAYLGLGAAYLAANQHDAAEVNARLALQAYGRSGNLIGLARAWERLGEIELEQDRSEAASIALLRAIDLFERSGASDGFLRCATRVMEIQSSSTTLDPSSLLQTLRDLHERGRTLARWVSSSQSRTNQAVILAKIQRVALDLAVSLNRPDDAAAVIEAGTSSTIASLRAMLAGNTSPGTVGSGSLQQKFRSLIAQLMDVEAGITIGTVDLDLPDAVTPRSPSSAVRSFTTADLAAKGVERTRIVRALDDLVSGEIRQIYNPATADPSDVLEAARRTTDDLIQISCPEGLQAGSSVFVVHTNAHGRTLSRSTLTADTASALRDVTRASNDVNTHRWGALVRRLDSVEDEGWHDLADALLPAPIISAMSTTTVANRVPRLTIVPDVQLWNVPWGALPIVHDAPIRLVEMGAVALAPSARMLSIFEDVSKDLQRTQGVAWVAGVNGSEIELAALRQTYGQGVSVPESPRELLIMLQTPVYGLLVTSVHGREATGLKQTVDLTGGVELSAAHLLGMLVPDVWIVGACWSGRVDPDPASDPLGLPTLALLNGCKYVIAGIYPLPDGRRDQPSPTAEFLADLYRSLGQGMGPDVALRHVQLEWLKAMKPVHTWAGLVAITSRATLVGGSSDPGGDS